MQKKQSMMLFTWLLICYEVACYLSMDAYVPALPSIANDFGITHNLAQLTVTAWLAGGLLLQPIIGPLSEHYGRRPILLTGGVCFVGASLLCLWSTNIHLLLIARIVQGMTVPTMFIAGYAAVHESFEKIEAIHTLARMQSITMLAPALGPLFGGILLVFFHWPWLFGMLAIWSGAAITSLFFIMPETLPVEKRSTSLNIKDIAAQYYRALTNTHFMRYILSACAIAGTMVAWITGSPFLIIDHFHYNTVQFGIVQGIVFGCFLLGNRVTKTKLTETNLHSLNKAGLIILTTGCLAAILLSYLLSHMLFVLIGSMMVVTLGSGMCFPILTRLAVDSSDEPMGIRMGILTFAQMAMAALSSAMVVIFYSGTPLSLAWVIACFPGVAIAATLLKREHPAIP